jgi:LuxR family maltose regulon positive regulatory protein
LTWHGGMLKKPRLIVWHLVRSTAQTLSIFIWGVIAMARGDTQDSVQHYEKGCRKSRRHFPHDVGLRLIGDVLTAELDLERNAIANVKRRLARVIDRLHGAEAWFDIYAAAYGTASEIYFLERGTDETLEFLDQAQARAEHLNLTKLRPLLDALRVASLTCAGDIDRALRVAECSTASFSEAGLDNGEGAAWREVESLATAWVRLMLRHGRYSDAIRTAEMALSYARPKGLARMTLRLNVLVAMCNYASGERTMALSRIGGVCREVTRTGYLRAVLREGADLASLLHDAGQTLTDETLRQRARELEKLLEGQDLAASRLPIFSPREIDVLRLLSKGLQDKVIGRRLGVTEHAVRFHLKNIYSKTRAHGRLEAIVRARELGILDQVAS